MKGEKAPALTTDMVVGCSSQREQPIERRIVEKELRVFQKQAERFVGLDLQ